MSLFVTQRLYKPQIVNKNSNYLSNTPFFEFLHIFKRFEFPLQQAVLRQKPTKDETQNITKLKNRCINRLYLPLQRYISNIKKITFLRYILLGLVITLLLTFVSCSSPKIKVSKEIPLTFDTSGHNIVTLFQVSNNSGPIWRIYPNNVLSLSDVKTIKYGEVPLSWKQDFPLNSAPPPLVEGEEYQAFAVVSDSDVVRVYFTMKEGKIVELPKKH